MKKAALAFAALLLTAVLAGAVDLKTKPDWKTSPYTGYTRATWEEISQKIISGVMQRVDPETGIFTFPISEGKYAETRDLTSEERIREMERIMIGVVTYYVGTGKDKVPGYKGSITQPFINAFIHGTDPNDPLYWGEPAKADQTGSGYILGLYMAPERFWDPLTDVQKKNLMTYLEKNNVNATWDNNHHLFHLVTSRFLETHGGEASREKHTKTLDRLLGWYRGDGWYIDGNNRGFDYYNLWGFQLYLNWILKFDPVWAGQFGDKIRWNASRFMETAPWLYSRSSGHIPWGRSLTYRFAASGAIGWNIINGDTTLSPGLARRLLSGDLKYFIDNGSLTDDGLLPIGYRGENLDLAERYNSPGDPYFAMEGLAVLLLPENHPFWTAVEEPCPADNKPGRKIVHGGNFVLSARSDGDSRNYFAGQTFDRTYWQAGAKYQQDAYSADLGFCVSGGDSAPTGQGQSGYKIGGRDWMYHWRSTALLLEEDHIASSYPMVPDYNMTRGKDEGTPEFECEHVYSHMLIGDKGEVHVLWHDYPTPVRLRLGGYGINVPFGSTPAESRDGGMLIVSSGNYRSVSKQLYGPEGTLECRFLQPGEGWNNTHLFGGLGAWPQWESKEGVPPFTPVVIYEDGSAHGSVVNPSISVNATKDGLRIVFEGKTYDIRIIDRPI
ncbi:MAG: DUF2264 domain-containing protein [Bacteroidales bacterium]|nr:DUF2264 domain-containing protein [Bacteroidales bacterium]